MDKQNCNIRIIIAPEFFARDVALIDLLDENLKSHFSKEEFIRKIKGNLVRVDLIGDDPYGYAILDKENNVKEYYADKEVKNQEEIQELLLQP